MRYILFFVTLLLVSVTSYAETDNPIDIELRSCLSQEKNLTTAGMANCVSAATQSWDKELNSTYQNLMKKLDNNQRERLKKAQIAWIKYRDAEIENIGSIYDSIPGTLYIPVRRDRVMDITKSRTLELKNYLTDLLGN